MISYIIEFWQNNGSDIANGAIVLSAIAGFSVIYFTGLSSKKKATVDILMRFQGDSGTQIARDNFLKALNEGTLDKFALKENRNTESSNAIRKILNQHEFMAVCIRGGIANEGSFRRWYYTTIITDWDATEGYIKALRVRVGTGTIYCEFEHMAKRWKETGFKNTIPLSDRIRRKSGSIVLLVLVFLIGLYL